MFEHDKLASKSEASRWKIGEFPGSEESGEEHNETAISRKQEEVAGGIRDERWCDCSLNQLYVNFVTL